MQGPRVIKKNGQNVTDGNGKKIIGVWSSPEELRQLYGREGFKIPQHENKIATWSDCFGDCGYIAGGVWYDISENVGLLLAAEKMAKDEDTDNILGY